MAKRGATPDGRVRSHVEEDRWRGSGREAVRRSPARSRGSQDAPTKRQEYVGGAPDAMTPESAVLPDDVLLQICKAAPDAKEVTHEWLADMRYVTRLIKETPERHGSQLGRAMSLLVSLLAQLPQHRLTHLLFGNRGPRLVTIGWLDREAVEQAGKQIVGLIWEDQQPEAVAEAVEAAIARALHVGFLEQQRYDAWRPGMRSGSGWRSALRATPYGARMARMPVEPPLPPPPAPEAQPMVELGRPGERCRVCGQVKKSPTHAQYAVVSALIDAGEDGLTKDALEAVRPSARRILKTLSKDPDWAQVIVMPGQTNGRYRIRA